MCYEEVQQYLLCCGRPHSELHTVLRQCGAKRAVIKAQLVQHTLKLNTCQEHRVASNRPETIK
jgi:hypothetical protein